MDLKKRRIERGTLAGYILDTLEILILVYYTLNFYIKFLLLFFFFLLISSFKNLLQ